MVVLPLYGRTLTVPCCSPFVDLPEGIAVSDSCMDLLRKMLTKDATKRPSAREVLAHPWLAKYDAGERISFTPVDVEKLRPPAALFLPPRIGDATKPVTVESIRHIGWLRKRGRLFSVSHQPVVCGLRCLFRFANSFSLQTWRKRFFELNGTDLTYFDKEEEGRKLKGEVDCALVRGLVLTTAGCCDAVSSCASHDCVALPPSQQLEDIQHAPKSSKPFRFYIRANKRMLYMQADSQDDMDGWFTNFNLILEANALRASHAMVMKHGRRASTGMIPEREQAMAKARAAAARRSASHATRGHK